MNQLTATLRDTFAQFWQARQERERTYLIVAAVVIVLTLIYLVAIEPAMSGREELRKSLPVLHQQAAEMQQMAQQLAVIPSAENRHEITRELIETEFSSNGLKAQTLAVNESVVRAQFSSASMSAVQTCLLDLQKTSGLFVEEMKITGLEGGLVSASFTLRQSNSGGSQ
ncbi:general secretion pathway protein M [Oxalobacteraceae bacterium GrIS 2.11]